MLQSILKQKQKSLLAEIYLLAKFIHEENYLTVTYLIDYQLIAFNIDIVFNLHFRLPPQYELLIFNTL